MHVRAGRQEGSLKKIELSVGCIRIGVPYDLSTPLVFLFEYVRFH